ncbi:hypothetical protein HLV39_02790 [Marinobacter adhaerens]|uniref:Alpha-L-glutamate ligase-related protein ATP-grasp domain-containing protein n=1 Tax=Marinobacter adhaerens TaxID=1033846 RepID=A0A851HSH9_9GAMM|nr:sugar-transfer associated ATP-grasp domain-containing protein [Marinobacter adhaerens]NWN90426.1 hypothetical protein [Marinobacter adhaerens]
MRILKNNLYKIINDSKKPEYKPFYLMVTELISYCSRLGLSPGEYFSYGLHKKNSTTKKALEYLPNTVHFEKHLPTLNTKNRNTLFDKLLFKKKVINEDIVTPKVIGYVGFEKRNDIEFNYLTRKSIQNIFIKNNIKKCIIKPTTGNQGRGVFLLEHTPGSNTPFSINKKPFDTSSLFSFIENFSKKNNFDHFMLETLITPPETIKNISPNAAPNIRIVTLRTPANTIHVTHASIRLGRKDSVTSNAGAGGILGKIDIESGEISNCKTNTYISGEFIKFHPDTKFDLIGFKLPFWREIINECKKAASLIESVNSIGWDVLITENGPVILEGNDTWCILSEQIFGEGYLTPKTRELLGQHGLAFSDHILPKPSLSNIRKSLFGFPKPKKPKL